MRSKGLLPLKRKHICFLEKIIEDFNDLRVTGDHPYFMKK